jgi:hypothetical protein
MEGYHTLNTRSFERSAWPTGARNALKFDDMDSGTTTLILFLFKIRRTSGDLFLLEVVA